MEKRKYDTIKTFSILVLILIVISLTAVATNAQNPVSTNAQSYNNSYMRPVQYGIGPYYPPAPYGDSGDSEVVCGPYGCYWNEATAYLPKVILAEQAW